jgi:hypothetical protein
MMDNKIKRMKINTSGRLRHQGAIGYGSAELEANFTFHYMLCYDMEDEIADFICLDTVNKRIVLIHAKAGNKQQKILII